jgi:hypothetical protein
LAPILATELVEDLDLEGPSVGGESGLGVQLRLGSLGNLGLRVSLHVSVVLDNLESVDSSVDGGIRLGVLRCLGGLHDLVLLGKLHVHVVLVNVGPRGLGVTLSSTQASLFLLRSHFRVHN